MFNNNNNLNKLQQQLCELKLAERRLNTEMHNLSTQNRLVDFTLARKINANRQNVRKEIAGVEAKIMPNIIA